MAKRGRPTKYYDGLIAKVDEYLATCVDTEREFHKTRGEKSDTYERIKQVNLPKIEGFSSYIDVHVDTINQWEKDYPIFSEALDKIRKEQHNRLIDGAISGEYNPVIAKLMLSSNHGYSEKSRVDHTTKDEKISNETVIRIEQALDDIEL